MAGNRNIASGYHRGLCEGAKGEGKIAALRDAECDKRLQEMALNYNTIIECKKAEFRRIVEEIFKWWDEQTDGDIYGDATSPEYMVFQPRVDELKALKARTLKKLEAKGE